MPNNVFSSVEVPRTPRSTFDLSYRRMFDAGMGVLYPVCMDEVVPGDKWRIGSSCLIRAMPLVAPVLTRIRASVHFFFVPNRLLMDPGDWEAFITRGPKGDGKNAAGVEVTLPRWKPTADDMQIGKLWDMLGFPIPKMKTDPKLSEFAQPLDFPRRAYNLIYNWFYRDENLQDEVALDNTFPLVRAWRKDYFTSALPWQQRGVAPAIPLSGYGSVGFPFQDAVGDYHFVPMYANSNPGSGQIPVTTYRSMYSTESFTGVELSVDSSTIGTFDTNDLRTIVQLQKWMERNARAGVRYNEYLMAHHGVSPRDDTLQMPVYIGGHTFPIIVSEILQTSQTTQGAEGSPLGYLGGHGLSADGGRIGTYFAKEFGYIVGLFSIIPDAAYTSGLNRQWLRHTYLDFFHPEFNHLSEQEVYEAEVCLMDGDSETAVGSTVNNSIFGFQGRYSEMRYKPDIFSGNLRSSLQYWHLGREFDPASPPQLNSQFIACNPSRRIFAAEDEPGFVVEYGNILSVTRQLPYEATPGFVDHF